MLFEKNKRRKTPERERERIRVFVSERMGNSSITAAEYCVYAKFKSFVGCPKTILIPRKSIYVGQGNAKNFIMGIKKKNVFFFLMGWSHHQVNLARTFICGTRNFFQKSLISSAVLPPLASAFVLFLALSLSLMSSRVGLYNSPFFFFICFLLH